MTKPAHFHIRIPPTTDAFLAALPEVHAFADTHALTRAERYALDVALEEYVTNLIHHGQPDAAGNPDAGEAPTQDGCNTLPVDGMVIDIRIALDADALSLTLEDAGAPFDPTSRPTPAHLDAPLEDRPIGGLGIHLMRNLFHEVSYECIGGRNQLHLRQTRTATPPDNG